VVVRQVGLCLGVCGLGGHKSLGGRGGGVGERVGDGVPTSSVPVRAVLVRQPALRRVESMAGETHTAAADDALEVHPEPGTKSEIKRVSISLNKHCKIYYFTEISLVEFLEKIE